MKAISYLLAALAAIAPLAAATATPHYTVIGWNDLGMHCMDSDYTVFSILPPFNVIHAQLIDSSGKLVTNVASFTCTYAGVADPTGSINTTSYLKTTFWQNVKSFFGVQLAPDAGLEGFNMPGVNNVPQAMAADTSINGFTAKGIPLTPYDNSGSKNYYPLMHITARNSAGTVVASTNIVLPVSDEMDCRACHASGSQAAAMPPTGWVNNSNPEKDFRLNVLLLHDEVQPNPAAYQQYLAQAGYGSGLYVSAMKGTPVLCARCHVSNALAPYGVPGIAGIPPLTMSVHSNHATVIDPSTGLSLNDENNRNACYTCHPGSTTRCLRGAMGNAVAADGTMAMQCQSCHGNMSAVGATTRTGWLDEPNCQACHTGTATHNNGQIRYTNALDASGSLRVPVDTTYATNPNTPNPGTSLYRFSSGHGGLQCEACHGPTHAELPSSEVNDNLQSIAIQGHYGKLVDCVSCHNSQPNTLTGGPHGMHPVGQVWVSRHSDAVESAGKGVCQSCHGSDYKGTVLSYAQGVRVLNTEFGTKKFWRGFQVSCYACHNGPNDDSPSPNHPPVAANGTAATLMNQAVPVTLQATDADHNTLTYRVVGQGANGRVGLSGNIATYFPNAGFTGTDKFTFAAWDGFTNSNLGTIKVTVQ